MKNVEDMYGLSPLQAGMLFHCLLAEREGLYFEQYMSELEGELDAAALHGAWIAVVARHAALRTAFVWEALREPLQVVFRRVVVPWVVVDVTNRPGTGRAWFERLLRRDRARPFVLTRAPLLRFTLVRLAADRHVLLWSVHHLVLDGWSRALVRREVADEYRAIRSGRTATTVPPAPFAGYIRWLDRQNAGAAEIFWRRHLLGANPTRLPPAGGAAPPVASGTIARTERVLSVETSASIRTAARARELTLNTVCLAAWAVVLGRCAGTDDVLFGETVSGRPPDLPEIERMVGVLVNTVAVRVSLPRGGPVIAWLKGLQAQAIAAREFGYAPLADVQRWSGIPGGVPLFETLVAYENYLGAGSETPAAPHGALRSRPLATVAMTNYPLTLTVQPGARLQAILEAHTGRIGVEAAGRLLDGFIAAVESLMANVDADVCDVPLLAAAEPAAVTLPPPAPPPASPAYVAARDAIELELVRMWEKLLNTQPIGVRDTFLERGGHSILMLRLAAQVERTFDVRIPLADLAQGTTIERLAFAIRQRGSGPETRLTLLQPAGDELPLFAIVPAGGTLACYLALASLMGGARPFYALQPRASLAEAASAMTIESMAREDAGEVRRVQPAGPYALVGWSVGGLVAYEMACQLHAAGERLSLLALLDTSVPNAGEPPRDAAAAAAQLVARQFSLNTRDLDDRPLAGEERLERMLERAREEGHLTHDVDLRWVRWLVDGFRIGVEAVQRYRPGPYDGRVVLMAAADSAPIAPDPDPTLGWGALARGGVDVYRVPGTHQSMVRSPHVEVLAERLRGCLDAPPAPVVENAIHAI